MAAWLQMYRLYVEIAAALLLAGLFGWYTIHERHIGRDAILAADARTVAAQVFHNKEVEDRAQVQTDAAMAAYMRTLSRPPAADAPHVVCHKPASPGPVPTDVSPRPAPASPSDSPAAGTFDPGPALDKLHEDADAEITALQAYVQACIDAKICKAP